MHKAPVAVCALLLTGAVQPKQWMSLSSGAQAVDRDTVNGLNKLYSDTHQKMRADQDSLQANIKKDIESFVQTLHPEASPAALSQFSQCMLCQDLTSAKASEVIADECP